MSLPNIEKYNVGLGAATTRTMKQKRMAQLYTDKVLNRLQMPIVTYDAQMAELQGIRHSIELILREDIILGNHRNVVIVCDCKNAVKFVTQNMNCPAAYSETLQDINEMIAKLTQKGINIHFHWIPGHTDNKWNDKVLDYVNKVLVCSFLILCPSYLGK
eukprot:211813_1